MRRPTVYDSFGEVMVDNSFEGGTRTMAWYNSRQIFGTHIRSIDVQQLFMTTYEGKFRIFMLKNQVMHVNSYLRT